MGDMFARKSFQLGIFGLGACAALTLAAPEFARAAGCPAGTLPAGEYQGHPLCSHAAFQQAAGQRPGGGVNPSPSKSAEQPKVVMPAATAEQKRLMDQVQQRLKASEAAEKNAATKPSGLTIPSKTAEQPKVVMPAATAEQKRLMEEVQQRLKASEAAQKNAASKAPGLTIPSKTAEQPKVVMPAATAEQKRLMEQVQQRLKAREAEQNKSAQQPAGKPGGLNITTRTPHPEEPKQPVNVVRQPPPANQHPGMAIA